MAQNPKGARAPGRVEGGEAWVEISTIPGLAEVSYISQGLYGHGCPFGLSCSS